MPDIQACRYLWQDIVAKTPFLCLELDNRDFGPIAPPRSHSFVLLLVLTLASSTEYCEAVSKLRHGVSTLALYEKPLDALLSALYHKKYDVEGMDVGVVEMTRIWMRLHEKFQKAYRNLDNLQGSSDGVVNRGGAPATPGKALVDEGKEGGDPKSLFVPDEPVQRPKRLASGKDREECEPAKRLKLT